MKNQSYKIQHAVSPREFKQMDTDELRESFLMENLFVEDQINMNYTHYDRMIVGGVLPVGKDLNLETIDPLKSEYFLERRELGIINIGATGEIIADGVTYTLENKEALYLGKGTKSVTFKSGGETNQPIFYFNSAPAHTTYPSKKISEADAEKVIIGSLTTSNHRKIRKLIVNSVVQTCQLQMGLTELKEGSVWNTFPAHTHDRRMEAYLYFDLPEDQMVCHFIGEPQQTRHIWMKNNQAVLSPPWSIHSGAGTSNYTFVWGMAGENLDYGDMDIVKPSDLK
ncbi:5-dehydro-4-deoxy-D-glucuronate isomerase [Algoriphagus antarcticus]|uniref:4-deoxy-L-threo-5-hexosulose-uronate ketol-isomerase n=1 Tax=Algoriphagus antarcticus TaxID=238540 RepID=A0A3E0DHI9_9BACT|nr:5-dehydro-4-deoxy-D-glucuronate isomerase [Algoriphagus antarcticus]REG82071.1 4-deoxy-L-threo-5-hexosulose-uronate ketol-isomerase [Algoriphagus antarcticus]